MKNCASCRFRADHSEHYWVCTIREHQPQPAFVSLYQTRGVLLIAREPFEDSSNPIHHSTLQDCPTWEKMK